MSKFRQNEVDSIKAEEERTPISDQVRKARYEAERLLCQTCDNGLCSSKCIK